MYILLYYNPFFHRKQGVHSLFCGLILFYHLPRWNQISAAGKLQIHDTIHTLMRQLADHAVIHRVAVQPHHHCDDHGSILGQIPDCSIVASPLYGDLSAILQGILIQKQRCINRN